MFANFSLNLISLNLACWNSLQDESICHISKIFFCVVQDETSLSIVKKNEHQNWLLEILQSTIKWEWI